MLICLMGPSCTGKSTLASTLHASKNISVSAGKDYLRLAKSEGEARRLFSQKLAEAVNSQEHLIYIVTEPDDLTLVPEGAFRIRCTAASETVRERFAARMRGTLPEAVAAMLDEKSRQWEKIPADLVLRTDDGRTAEALCAIVCEKTGL